MIEARRATCVGTLAALLLWTTASVAEPDSPQRLFSRYATPPTADAAVSRDKQVVRSEAVQINRHLLVSAADRPKVKGKPQQTLLLNLFDDAQLIADLDAVERSARGLVWTGRLRGVELSQVVIAVFDDIVSGNISTPAARYHIRYMGKGVHEVQKIDTSLFPDDEPYVAIPSVLHYTPAADLRGAGAQADDGSTIDVMVAYTATTRAAAGGTSAMQSLIDLAVSETNQSYQNSGITQRIRLIHSVEVAYTEPSGDTLTAALNCVTSTSDGCLDEIHTLRDAYGADLVSLWLENGGGYCGLGWLMTSVSSSFAGNGFNAVARSCATGYYSFGHELGHNMGARHDTYVDSASTPYSYAHGYTNASAASPWRTVMAYNNACSAAGKNCTRIQYWSNPSITYGGAAMGNSTADNRSTLNNTANTVANFRTAAPSGYSLSVNSSGASGVSIGAAPSTYAGTTNYSKSSIAAGTGITLSAPATAGSATFGSWNGCDSASGTTCTLTMNSSKSVTASYNSSASNTLQNAGFESGATAWTQTSSGGYSLIVNATAYSPHAGSYYAWLGGYNSGTDTLEQSVAIPASAKSATIEFWYRIETSETTTSAAYDTLTVELYNSSGSKLTTLATLSNLNKTNGAWVKSSALDVLAYKGQTVRLRFTGKTDSTNTTDFLIDDVNLAIGTGSTKKGSLPIMMLLE